MNHESYQKDRFISNIWYFPIHCCNSPIKWKSLLNCTSFLVHIQKKKTKIQRSIVMWCSVLWNLNLIHHHYHYHYNYKTKYRNSRNNAPPNDNNHKMKMISFMIIYGYDSNDENDRSYFPVIIFIIIGFEITKIYILYNMNCIIISTYSTYICKTNYGMSYFCICNDFILSIFFMCMILLNL